MDNTEQVRYKGGASKTSRDAGYKRGGDGAEKVGKPNPNPLSAHGAAEAEAKARARLGVHTGAHGSDVGDGPALGAAGAGSGGGRPTEHDGAGTTSGAEGGAAANRQQGHMHKGDRGSTPNDRVGYRG